MKNIYLHIPDPEFPDAPLVLATVVRTIGSTPRETWIFSIIRQKGLISGTVGGGGVEGRVQKLAADAILSGNSGLESLQSCK